MAFRRFVIFYKTKKKLYYKSIKYKTAYNEILYTRYRNKLKHILQKAEKDHYACLLESYKSNMRKTWGVLKEIINKNKIRKKSGTIQAEWWKYYFW